MTELQERMRDIFDARDRANMQPTIDAFLKVLTDHPGDPEVLYEVGGSYDTDGQEDVAAAYYERALAQGLEGETLRRCFLQYGSTLRNLGRIDESLAVFSRARSEFPASLSLGVFELLTLHAQGKRDAALAAALTLIADHVQTEEMKRYEASIRGNAEHLAGSSSPTTDDASESGALFYDRPGVAERYGAHRHSGVSSPNFVMEEPALLAELGDVAGLHVLDLGCGDAAAGAMLMEQGCASYLGIDGSKEMVARAEETLTDTRGRVVLQNMEELPLPAGSLDRVISRLALHYVQDLDAVLRSCRAALRPGGRVCFSVLHPVITSSDAQSSPDGPRGSWTVDDYFVGGARERLWMGDTVTWFHRTIEQYVGALTGAGFSLAALRECEPEPGRFGGDEPELSRRRRAPLFLLLSASAT